MSEEKENKGQENAKIEKLVLKAQAGDIKAFGEIYDILIDRIYRYIFFKVNNEDALDLTENVFLKVWENIKKYKKQAGGSFSSWVYRIAHNMVVDHHRFKKETYELDPRVSDNKKESNPELVAEQALSKDKVRIALKKLKPNYKEVLTLFFINDLSNTEVAQIMKKNEGSLRVLKFRALKELQKILEEMGINY